MRVYHVVFLLLESDSMFPEVDPDPASDTDPTGYGSETLINGSMN